VVEERGRLDVLVNNAGITGFESGVVAHDPERASLDDWRAVLETNLDSVFLGCKYAIRAMRPRGSGAIVNISSRSGLVGIPGAAAYAASKAGVRNHTKTVALYCAEQGLNSAAGVRRSRGHDGRRAQHRRRHPRGLGRRPRRRFIRSLKTPRSEPMSSSASANS
jgi:NAD(P)-dependent dehydrogenase (short-subunit alcohol dehydrogenase family)